MRNIGLMSCLKRKRPCDKGSRDRPKLEHSARHMDGTRNSAITPLPYVADVYDDAVAGILQARALSMESVDDFIGLIDQFLNGLYPCAHERLSFNLSRPQPETALL